jgi:AraC family transcriptional regulator
MTVKPDKNGKHGSMMDAARGPSARASGARTSTTGNNTFPAEATLRDYKARMLRVLVHIQQHLDDPLRLEDLAGIACFSPHHFHRVFRGMLGEPVAEHIRRLRLERAAGQLKLGGKPVVQIAFDAGYETHEAFSRAFKTAFGVAPSRFRCLQRPSRFSGEAVKAIGSGVHYKEGKQIRGFKVMRSTHRSSEIAIKCMPSMRVAFVRHFGPYSGCGAAWEKLCTFLGKEGMLGGQTQFIGLSHDDPEVTPHEKLRYDACLTVDVSFRPNGEIGVQIIPGGDYALTTHFGPYEKLNKTYARLMGQWLPRSGRELGDSSCLEIYLNDPNSTAPGDLVTDVYIPLKTVNFRAAGNTTKP